MDHQIHAKSLHLGPTLCDPSDYSLPGSSVHGILQARILQWVAIPFTKSSFQARDRMKGLMSLALAGRFFTTSTTWGTLGIIG